MATLVDFHCHLDLYQEPGAFASARDSKAYVLSVTTTPSAWRGTLARSGDCRRIRTALGLHPQLAHVREPECGLFEELLSQARYVGEIGLDGSDEYRMHFGSQMRVLERILRACSRVGGRVLSVHSRGASAEVLDVLERHSNAGVAVLHWFTGTKSELRRAVDLGCWFSVGPAMLATKRGRELATQIPRNRLLTETDGPFAKVGGQPLQPAHVGQAVEGLSKVWRTDTESVQEGVLGNLRELLRAAGIDGR